MKFIKISGLIIIFISIVSGNFFSNGTDDDTEEKYCGKYQVCNLVHHPHFGNSEVEKFCDCPKNTFCPTTFSATDGYSISVNVRTQMKFCSKVEDMFLELPECEEDQPSLVVREMFEINKLLDVVAVLTCKCNKNPVYWRHSFRTGTPINSNEKLFESLDYYECKELTQCETNDFCGLARTDYGFIFQRCTCSEHDRCRFYVEDSEIVEDVEELFYNNLYYRSYCLRKANSNVW